MKSTFYEKKTPPPPSKPHNPNHLKPTSFHSLRFDNCSSFRNYVHLSFSFFNKKINFNALDWRFSTIFELPLDVMLRGRKTSNYKCSLASLPIQGFCTFFLKYFQIRFWVFQSNKSQYFRQYFRFQITTKVNCIAIIFPSIANTWTKQELTKTKLKRKWRKKILAALANYLACIRILTSFCSLKTFAKSLLVIFCLLLIL